MEVSTLNIALYRWLHPFLEYIKTKGFTVSPDTHIQLLKILTGLSDKISDSDTLFDYIAPVLAKSGEQYKQLKLEFDNYYSNESFLVRLRRENKQLKLEREILSKAAAWFAQETNVIPPKGSVS
jgi:hypothetical protein